MSDQTYDSEMLGFNWLSRLGLTVRSYPGDHRERALLRTITPTAFVRQAASGVEHLSLDDVAAELESIRSQLHAEAAGDAERRQEIGWARVREALAAPDAEDVVEDGSWAGFTRGRALAWCWNLYQYEPHGFISPGSHVRARNVTLLKKGELPDGFGYAARAAELERNGLDPKRYRRMQELMGKRIYDRDGLK